jgi:hypothetical protein
LIPLKTPVSFSWTVPLMYVLLGLVIYSVVIFIMLRSHCPTVYIFLNNIIQYNDPPEAFFLYEKLKMIILFNSVAEPEKQGAASFSRSRSRNAMLLHPILFLILDRCAKAKYNSCSHYHAFNGVVSTVWDEMWFDYFNLSVKKYFL